MDGLIDLIDSLYYETLDHSEWVDGTSASRISEVYQSEHFSGIREIRIPPTESDLSRTVISIYHNDILTVTIFREYINRDTHTRVASANLKYIVHNSDEFLALRLAVQVNL